jgi:DNA-binding response OmpR family regulator
MKGVVIVGIAPVERAKGEHNPPSWTVAAAIIAMASHVGSDRGHLLTLSGEEKKERAVGCDDCVPKPFSARQLLAKIRQCMPQ